MKSKRYLITVACQQADKDRRGKDRTLTHTLHATVQTAYLHHAQQQAEDLACEHGAAMFKEHTSQLWDDKAKAWLTLPSTIGPCSVISVEPVKRKARRAKLMSKAAKSNWAFESTAAEYALWLAKRDGVALANDYRTTVHWDGVTNAKGKWERRIRAVSFGQVTIDIPNWDWQPAEPVEMIDADQPELLAA